MLYFGGNMGLVHFKPESILPKISKRPCGWCSEEIKVNSVVQQPSDDGILTQQLNDTERIVLDHKQRNLDINYEALAFLSPEKIRYAYRLHGGDIDEEWNYIENRTSANYSHLPAGRYVFELTAQNPDGFWNSEPRRLEIVIKPSPLLTWYAFLFYILTAGTAAWFAKQAVPAPSTAENGTGDHRKELEREKELTNMKINFFTNISHELRTPLTLIYGPVNMLPDIQDKKRLHELINLINDNIQRLLKLVDQTLSLSRIENDTLPLSVCRQDILPLVERMMAGFACYAREKQNRRKHDEHAAGQDDRCRRCGQIQQNTFESGFQRPEIHPQRRPCRGSFGTYRHAAEKTHRRRIVALFGSERHRRRRRHEPEKMWNASSNATNG